MKIGVVRHFKVDYKLKKMMNSKEFEVYNADYDDANIIENKIEINIDDWDKCYCSDLLRTIKTANSFWNKELIVTNLLREVKMYPIRKLNLKIPSFLWSVSSRIAWMLNHVSQLENADCTRKRARKFLNSINLNSSENVLIVSHGFFLITLIKQLKILGFKGRIPRKMKNGYLYILEK